MDRRRFVAALGSALAAPLARAQVPAAKVYRIGFLGIAFASGYVREVEWMREGLRKLGYIEGRNIVIDFRWADGDAMRLKQIAAEFVKSKVDAILTHALPGAIAAAAVSSAVPIVMADGGDPVEAGLAKSFGRPGRNVTGSFSFIFEEIGKRLELLKEILPRLRRVGFLSSTADMVIEGKRKALAEAAASMKLEIQEFTVRDPTELPPAFNNMEKARLESILINNESLLNSQTSVIAALAAVKRMPSVGYPSYADAGGLLAYGTNRAALYGRAGYFLDRIFKGENPGDIPFERASKFDLVVNGKTAKSIGLSIPPSLLARADRVIE